MIGTIYTLSMNTGTSDRVLTIDAVPLESNGNASFALRSENGTKYIETEPPGADITYPDAKNYTSLDFRKKPALRMSELDIENSDVINAINEASRENRVITTTLEGSQTKSVDSRLNSLHNGPFIVFIEDSRRAVYLQYTITER